MAYLSRRTAPLLVLLLAACPGDPDTSTGSEASSAAASDTGLSQSNTSDPASTSTGTSADASTGDPPTTGGPGTDTSSPDLPPGVDCRTDADCQLIDNCCDCAGAPSGQEPPPCMNPCAATRCDDDFGIEVAVQCRNGLCALAAGSCAGSPACDEPPPDCNVGTIPAGEGDCWGECRPANICGGSCSGDDPNSCGVGWVCVASQSQSGFCEPVPLGCGGVPTCDCVYADTQGSCLGACSDDGDGNILCEDGG